MDFPNQLPSAADGKLADPDSKLPEEARASTSQDSSSAAEGLTSATLVSNNLSDPASTALPHRMLGQYELLELLGQGGMGSVFRARHTKLDKFVAIKLLPADFMRTPQAVARFEREMRAVGKIVHPNIVQAHDAGEIAGTHYIAMELVEGSDLSKVVKERGKFAVKEACKAIRQAALGLDAAHKSGLFHRDIKPSNLLLAKTGQIKILDLGLARMSDDTAHQEGITSAGQMLGTPDFMAPEQWEDSRAADARTDLYALGCTLFFLLTGQAPFATDDFKSVVRKMSAHVSAPIPDLQAICADVPDGVNAIYRRLMAKRPEDRFASAGELAAALAPFTPAKTTDVKAATPATPSPSGKPLGVTAVLPLPSGDAGASLSTTVAHAPSSNTAPSPPRRSNRKLLAGLAGGIAVLLLGVIIITIANRDGTKTKIEVAGDSKVEVAAAEISNLKAQISNLKAQISNRARWHGWPVDAPAPAIAPFDAAQAKKHQQEWADYLKLPVEHTNSIGMKFVLIPPGEFTMGSTAAEVEAALKGVGDDKYWQECLKSEAPQHKVVLTQAIYLGVNEVTQKEYEAVMKATPSHFSAMGPGKEAVANLETQNHPVETVSWNDAAEFCEKLSQKEELKPFYFRAGETITLLDGTGYRLPTEAEWEFACRAGTTTKYWIGDKDEQLVRAGWFHPNSGGRTHAAGELKANPLGLYDIHGNVLEWVEDAWEPTYYAQFGGRLAINPNCSSSAGSRLSARGGDWHFTASRCGSAVRVNHHSGRRDHFTGFRVSLVAVSSRVSR